MPPAEERPSLRARARAHRRRWIGRLVLAAVLALVGYLVLTFVQVLSASRDDDRVRSDAIVVLGAAQYDGTPSPVLRQRLDHALDLYRDGVAGRIVLTGGKQAGDRFTEAYAGYRYLTGRGVPGDDLLVVTDGSSTWDSLRAAERVLRREGLDRVTLVSDSYHSRRLLGVADEVGLDAGVSPSGAAPTVPELLRETGLVALGQVIGYGRMLRLSS
ncbi:MAG TPA: YdcF family protein [Microthrixaceae bacterium]|nr:YdcF family protein [Microthrixaceae bacterium]MCB9375311.1 YdcF family protein [Microthrixaceae bacterium]MCB9401330.1 YdcF family protein [Microthrixaceae bacterium]MCO5306780.1 YdcF family protein [Microthrixaceae bacterium]HMU80174.1 YdcF family protein [Microthrixaceae bacterium]